MNVPEKYKEYDELLKTKLDDYRYIHSLGVAKSARHLAELYGADPEKAYFAGLLHDVMKNAAPEEQLQIIEKADIMLSPSERLNRKLWHAIAGAAFLKLELHITDEDIIGAVRWHTTGKANMTQLEKIVYLADFISEDRKYPDVDKVRELSEQSIESAMLYTQRYCISKLLADGMIIDPSSVDCYNATGTSNTHVKSLADDLEYEMGKLGAAPEHIEGRATGWILLDFGSVLVHLFQKDQREYYNLERLWNDAQQLDISDLLTD